jgi:hypothetical protein
MGLVPRNAATSMGRPVFWTISAIGRMSLACVRAAQYAVIFIFVGNDFARQRGDVFDRARTGSGQPKVERVDAERLHQVEDFDLLFNGRVADGGRLQPSRRVSSVSAPVPADAATSDTEDSSRR